MKNKSKKTYAEDFFEKFPDAPRFNGMRPTICRYYLYPEGCLDEHGRCQGDPKDEGCIACWNEIMDLKKDKGGV